MRVLSRLLNTHGVALAASATLIAIGGPTVALATVHTGSITFPEPTWPQPSLEPRPPLVEYEEFDHTISVAYDDQTGTVTVRTEVFAPAHWGERHQTSAFILGRQCPQGGVESYEQEREAGRFYGTWEIYENPYADEPKVVKVVGVAGLEGFMGTVKGAGSFDGQTFAIPFQSPYFTGREWRCFTTYRGSGQGARSFSLGGYPPQTPAATPTPKNVVAHRATKAQLASLTKAANAHHSDGFDVRHQYLANARVTNNGWADAEQRFRRPSNPGQRQRGVFIVFRVIGGHWRVVTYGSSVCVGNTAIPFAVCRALKL